MSKFPLIIGRSEFIDIIDVVPSIPSKIDTGAYRSSIHAKNIKEVSEDGKKVLTADLLGHPISPIVYPMKFEEYRTVQITNSFGTNETRFEVTLKVKLGPKIFKTSFALADRASNFYPVLIGRTFLKNRFIVDVSSTSIDRQKLRKEFKIDMPQDEEDLE